MKWYVYLLAAALVLASFPLSMAFSTRATRKGHVAGVTMIVGMAFLTVVDPRAAAAIEMIGNRREVGDSEGDAVGGRDA